jgi:DNA-binding NtrC family response regulator
MENMQQKTILIIETHQALQMLYEAELQEAGFNTLLASNTNEAQHLLAGNSVDLLMADMPGRQATSMSTLTLLAKAHNIPLLINTSYPLSMIERSVISAAVYLQEKSSDIDKLKNRVSTLLGNLQCTSPSLNENKGQQALAGKFDGHTRNHQSTFSLSERGLG